jgi:hypothetical protein
MELAEVAPNLLDDITRENYAIQTEVDSSIEPSIHQYNEKLEFKGDSFHRNVNKISKGPNVDVEEYD